MGEFRDKFCPMCSSSEGPVELVEADFSIYGNETRKGA